MTKTAARKKPSRKLKPSQKGSITKMGNLFQKDLDEALEAARFQMIEAINQWRIPLEAKIFGVGRAADEVAARIEALSVDGVASAMVVEIQNGIWKHFDDRLTLEVRKQIKSTIFRVAVVDGMINRAT